MSSGSSCASVWKHSVLSSCQGPCLSQHPLSSLHSWCLPGPHASPYQCPCLSQHPMCPPFPGFLVCNWSVLASEQLGSLALPLWRAGGGSTAHNSWWSKADCWPSRDRPVSGFTRDLDWGSSTFPSSLMRPHLPPTAETDFFLLSSFIFNSWISTFVCLLIPPAFKFLLFFPTSLNRMFCSLFSGFDVL